MPGVDGGILLIERRATPLVPDSERAAFQAFAHRVFTGAGCGLPAVLRRAAPERRSSVDRWLRASDLDPKVLPRDLTAEQWAQLWSIVRSTAGAAGKRRRRRHRPRRRT